MRMKKQMILLITIVSTLSLKAQTYLSSTISSQNIGFNLLGNNIITNKRNKNIYIGFGVTFFKNKGNKGQDLTNFIQPNADVYEVLNAANGSIYGMYGRKYKNCLINLRIGTGSRKWIYNGKTGLTNWYVVKDGGTYLLYGADVRKTVGRFDIGLSYDNFNRAGIVVGFHMLDH